MCQNMDVLLVVSLTQIQVSFNEIYIDKTFSLLHVIVATSMIIVLDAVINLKVMIKVIIIELMNAFTLFSVCNL